MGLDRPQVLTLDAAAHRTSAKWLGALGNVGGLNYSFTCSGGASAMSCVLVKPSTYRTDAVEPGRVTRVVAGGSVIWDGVLDEPQYSDEGIALAARGSGTLSDDYRAVFDTWTKNPDESVNGAIARGLPWDNPGIGRPPGMWLGQKADSGSLSVTDLLDLVCARGGLAWYVNPRQARNHLSVFPLPDAPTRTLVASSPVSRTLGGDVNAIRVRYQEPGPLARFYGTRSGAGGGSSGPLVSSTPGGAPLVSAKLGPSYKETWVVNQDSIDRHGRMEAFLDLGSAGTMLLAEAQGVAANVLRRYQRISYAGPFTVVQGQYLNMGGTPVDLATEHASGQVARLLITDFGYGGEANPRAPKFIVGEYAYDVDSMTATVTPMETVSHSLADLLRMRTDYPGHGTGAWAKR